MKARLCELTPTFDGKQRLLLETDDDFRAEYDRLNGKDLRVEIKLWREKRSLSANAYAWVLIDKIAQRQRLPKVEVYRNAIRDIGGVSEVVCVKNVAVEGLKKLWTGFGLGWQVDELDSNVPGWTNLVLYKGSSVYDREQMAALIDSLVQDAQSLGIETRPQEEIESLLQEVEQYGS